MKYKIINCRIRGPVAGQPSLLWQPFCASLVGGVVLMLASKNENYVTIRSGVMAHFTSIHYMLV